MMYSKHWEEWLRIVMDAEEEQRLWEGPIVDCFFDYRSDQLATAIELVMDEYESDKVGWVA